MREAANALIRVHKASTQNQKLRTKTSKISMSQRDNRKSCHSDHYLAEIHPSSGTGSRILPSSRIQLPRAVKSSSYGYWKTFRLGIRFTAQGPRAFLSRSLRHPSGENSRLEPLSSRHCVIPTIPTDQLSKHI